MPRRLATFIAHYFTKLRIAFHDAAGLTGFVIFLVIFNQVISGTMLAFSFATESMNVPLSREEEDAENLYTDDFFWLHERGVDLLELFLFLHLLRKLYLSVADIEQEVAWKSGALLFLLLQGVVFTGLVLCCTHLSDITLVIASNIVQTLCLFVGKLYWLFFTDQTLNIDTITRMGYAHFTLGIVVSLLSVYHGIDMHYDWKTDADFDGIKQEINWFDEALVAEIGQTLEFFLLLGLLCLYLFSEPEALSYEIFMWGDIGMITDVRFFGVAPHWYFRPYMSWLLSCPFHYTGILGLILFFISFYFQPNIVGRGELDLYHTVKTVLLNFLTNFKLFSKRLVTLYRVNPDTEFFYFSTYSIFIVTIWYAFSYLPYGRFFNRLGGNDATLLAFAYIFIYVGGVYFRIPHIYNLRKSLAVNMNVYIYPFFDAVNWPFTVGIESFINLSGIQLVIPRLITRLEVMADCYVYIFFLFCDYKANYSMFINFCELNSIKVYKWILNYVYQGLIAEFNITVSADLETNFYKPSNLLITIFNVFIISVFFFLSTLYLYAYGLRNTSTNKGLTEGGIFLYAYLDEVEEECGQIEDAISYVVYFAVFVLWFFFFNIFASAIILNNINWIITIFCFILILGLVVPSSLLTQIGLAFAQYIRGSGRGTSILFETLLDFVSVSVIIIRFFVQNVRFVFIFVGFFEYYEYIDSKIYPLHDFFLPYITWADYWKGYYSNWYWFELLPQIFIQIISYLYYIGHLTITYIAQLSIYIILSFWIYFFLYTTFALPSKEKYFYFKRYALLKN